MTNDAISQTTFNTRVENWECDFNGHWNTRFYGDSFASAAESVGALAAGREPITPPANWHFRFHHELFSATPVEVRSFAMPDEDDAVLHVLSGSGRVAATAIGRPHVGADRLAKAGSDILALALPRGLAAEASVEWEPGARTARTEGMAEVGILKPSMLDSAGQIRLIDLIRICGIGAHSHIAGLGFTPQFTDETGIGRMLVEHRASLFGPCPTGSPLQLWSRLTGVGAKSFTTAHLARTRGGTVIAFMEQFLLAADMRARRATETPSFLRDLL